MRLISKRALRPPPLQLVAGTGADMLVLSMRRVAGLVGNCFQYEFEDVLVQTIGADRVEPLDLERVELERRAYRALRSVTGSAPLALRLTPRTGGLRLDKTYDMFLAVFNHAHEVFAVNAIRNWRQRCRYAACVVSEAFEANLPGYLMESLAAFDRIYVCSNPVESIQKISGRPTSYLSLAVDVPTFCPYPDPPARSIDVLGIGRRSDVTHAALMAAARTKDFFYYYDTVRTTAGVVDPGRQITFSVIDSAQHRFKLASLLKRSRYYLASRARSNEAWAADDEISGRFYEGAAAGAIMIGDPPRGGRYLGLFDWPEVVVSAPWDDPDIVERIAELEKDKERRERIRRGNITNALLRHDWAYRARTILEDARMPIPAALLAREARLRELADMARSAPIEA